MGREVRRVPMDWEHPKVEGEYIPLLRSEDFEIECSEWRERHNRFLQENPGEGIWEDEPDPSGYMPSFQREEHLGFQMYENTSEGTPISPVFDSPEALARWLVDNNASAFGGLTASYTAWLRVCRGGYAPSMVMNSSGITSGVEGVK